MTKKLKYDRVEGKTFEYWFKGINVEEPRIIIEADNWKEADKIFRKLIKAIRNETKKSK